MPASSQVKFTIHNFGVAVDGTFAVKAGFFRFHPASLMQARGEVTVEIKTIATGIALRDRHLLKEEYFAAQSYPTAHIVVNAVKKREAGYWAEGMLRIKGITKKVGFLLEGLLEQNGQMKLAGRFSLTRSEFGIGGRSWSLGDEVNVVFEMMWQRDLSPARQTP